MPPDEQKTCDLWALLMQQTKLDQIGAKILNGGPRAIRYRELRPGRKSMVFVARHDDVVRVLADEDDFSLCHYDALYSAIAPPRGVLIMRPEDRERKERLGILKAAAAKTDWFGTDPKPRRALARACVDSILAAVRRRRRFDLIGEYGFFAPYLISKRVFGLPGPRNFGILPPLLGAVNALPFGRKFTPETGPWLTQIAWSEFVLAQVLMNFENRCPLVRWSAVWGLTRERAHIERQIDKSPGFEGTLLGALWTVRRDFPAVEDDVYRDHVVSILMELGATINTFPGMAFSGIIDRWLKPRGPGFEASLQRLREMDHEDFVQEELRLAPLSGHLLRNATARMELGGLLLEEGEYVCALVKAAGRDIPDEPGEVIGGRCPNTYLHFGPESSPHQCFGHRLAPAMLAEMFLGLTRLSGLGTPGDLTDRGPAPGRRMVDFGAPGGVGP